MTSEHDEGYCYQRCIWELRLAIGVDAVHVSLSIHVELFLNRPQTELMIR